MNKYLEEYQQLQKEYLADDIERTRLLAHALNYDEQVEEIANRQWVNRDRRQVLEIILNNPYLQSDLEESGKTEGVKGKVVFCCSDPEADYD